MNWPSLEQLCAAFPAPAGMSFRYVEPRDAETMPGLLRAWFPAASTGAESVFMDAAFWRRNLVEASDYFAIIICSGSEAIGFQAFERQPASLTLHARLGALAPEARTGFAGALGFGLFEAMGRLTGAEQLQVFVTLATKGQQLFAERRGFRLAGLVPAFDRDLVEGRGVRRVMEALYVKTLAAPEHVVWPEDSALTAHTRAALKTLYPERRG